MASDDRFSMTTEKYLGKQTVLCTILSLSLIALLYKSYNYFSARHQVLVYMEDAVAQLLEHREENSKINPIKFLCE